MPVSESKSFKKFVASFEALALPGGKEQAKILAGCAMGAREALRIEQATSSDPAGNPWERTKRGKPALQGNKIGSSFSVQIINGGIAGKSDIEWLEAHQDGHVWPKRQQAEASRFYDKRGNRITANARKDSYGLSARILRLKFIEERRTAAHTVGQRELPARPIAPVGNDLGSIWADRLNAGVERGLRNWAESAT